MNIIDTFFKFQRTNQPRKHVEIDRAVQTKNAKIQTMLKVTSVLVSMDSTTSKEYASVSFAKNYY